MSNVFGLRGLLLTLKVNIFPHILNRSLLSSILPSEIRFSFTDIHILLDWLHIFKSNLLHYICSLFLLSWHHILLDYLYLLDSLIIIGEAFRLFAFKDSIPFSLRLLVAILLGLGNLFALDAKLVGCESFRLLPDCLGTHQIAFVIYLGLRLSSKLDLLDQMLAI